MKEMELEADDDSIHWKTFHNKTREYVVFLLLFIFLYVSSYFFISLYRKKVHFYSDCYEDAVVYRISLWMSTFSLSVSLGAALLLPFSIISNEVLLLYPNSYYVQWLNSSLIQGLWNHVFLFSNIALFILLPFAHLFIESEGFPGSSKGIMARVYETVLVLGLSGMLIMGIIFIISAMFDRENTGIDSAFKIFSYYLPFLYSCISFLGVLMLLICTPVGFGRLFSVMTLLLKKPKFTMYLVPVTVTDSYKVLQWQTDEDLGADNSNYNVPYHQEELPCFSAESHLVQRRKAKQQNDSVELNSSDEYESVPAFDTITYDDYEEDACSRFSISSIKRNCLYPFVICMLVLLTVISLIVVCQNTLQLCFGKKTLPFYAQDLSLGINSLSTLGPAGAALEIVLIMYLWCTSVIGLYSLPLFCHLRPVLRRTSMTQIIGNCAVVLVLSSALPVLARSLGITNFDLLGNFGRINWLGNFYIVLFHNIVFIVTVSVCLGKRITYSVLLEMYHKLLPFSSDSSLAFFSS